MSLFQRLLTLHHSDEGPATRGPTRTEDYFTELVATAIRSDRELLRRWLRRLGYTLSSSAVPLIRTQVCYPAIGEGPKNRIDIVIDIEDEGNRDLIFIESKVGSEEGDTQLWRYAKILEGAQVRNRHLIYVTQRHDPKSAPDNKIINFRNARWFEFYEELKRGASGTFQQELCTFMEIQGLNQSNRLTPLDLIVFGNAQRTITTLHGIIEGVVDDSLFNGQSPERIADSFLRTQGRVGFQWNWNQLSAGFGFAPPVTSDIGAPPTAHVALYIGPKAESRSVIRTEMIAAARNGEWEGLGLEETTPWFGVQRSRPLDSFGASPDQRAEIEVFFRTELKRLEAWMDARKISRS